MCVPSMAVISTRWRPIGFGRWGDRVLKTPFEQAYMKALFDYGYQRALKGYDWAKAPPRSA